MILDISVRRIGGMDGPRVFTGSRGGSPTSLNCVEVINLDSSSDARYSLQLQLEGWTDTGIGDFLGCSAGLSDVTGRLIGRRPAYLYRKPYDHPTFTSFEQLDNTGLWVLAMRVVAQ